MTDAPAFKNQVHVSPYAEANMSAYINLDTYDNATTELALMTVHGENVDSESSTVDLWLTPTEVVAIRDGLDQLLKEPDDD